MISIKIIAQRDIAKIDLTKAVFSNIQFSHEHLLKQKDKSVGGAINFIIPRSAPLKSFMDLSNDTKNILSGIKYYGVGFSGNYRYYLFNHGNYPIGFYFSPFLRGGFNRVYGNYTEEINSIEQRFSMNGYFYSIGGGIDIGRQWIIKRTYSIDIRFISVGANCAIGNVTATSSEDFFTLDNYLEQKFNPYFDKFGYMIAEIEDDSQARITFKQMLPNFNIGIKIGFFF